MESRGALLAGLLSRVSRHDSCGLLPPLSLALQCKCALCTRAAKHGEKLLYMCLHAPLTRRRRRVRQSSGCPGLVAQVTPSKPSSASILSSDAQSATLPPSLPGEACMSATGPIPGARATLGRTGTRAATPCGVRMLGPDAATGALQRVGAALYVSLMRCKHLLSSGWFFLTNYFPVKCLATFVVTSYAGSECAC